MNFKFIYITVFILLFYACGNPPESNAQTTASSSQVQESVFKDISVPEAKKLISQNKDLVIVDVRTPEEIAKGKIDGAIEMDFYSPDFNAQLEGLDKNKTYLMYCRSGNRSGQTMNRMKSMGFHRVYNMQGGYNVWSSSN